jgi:hypothetical protein
MKTFSKHKWWMLTVLLSAPVVAIAADVPNMFTSGTVISSSQVNANFKNLSDRMTALEAAKPVSTYVRWGQNTCPGTATLLYSGWAAGGHYTHTGGGVTTLCLAGTPEWLTFDDGNQNASLIYGTEFETRGYGVAGLGALQDLEGSCSVCEIPRRAQVMIPGRVSCPTGWTMEYNGYVMSHHYQQVAQSDYVCVDAAPARTGDTNNSDGHLWYPTEIECGALPCTAATGTGYVQDRELACVVCSK